MNKELSSTEQLFPFYLQLLPYLGIYCIGNLIAKFTHESSLRLLICSNIFPNKFVFAKQCGRAQWGNISSELARTIIACGVEATARSRHNVTHHQYSQTSSALTQTSIIRREKRMVTEYEVSYISGRLYTIASIRVDKITKYSESNAI